MITPNHNNTIKGKWIMKAPIYQQVQESIPVVNVMTMVSTNKFWFKKPLIQEVYDDKKYSSLDKHQDVMKMENELIQTLQK